MSEIGGRRSRVTIERKTRSGSGANVTETWSAVGTVWAKVDPKGGREIVAADQVVHRLTHLVTLRRRTDVTTAMRVNYKGRIMAILGMREIAEGGWRWTELQCEEGAPS